jgi:uncharacterized protein YcfJ
MKLRLIAGLLAATSAGIAQADAFMDHARVRSVEPQYETVQVPREQCGRQVVYDNQPAYESRNYTGAVVGGVAGGILGNQVGKGSGKHVATAVGAVVGALAGDHLANRGDRHVMPVQAPREVTTCRTVMEQQTRVNGYRVQYEYRGHMYSTVTREDPGPTMPVRVSVVPVDQGGYRRY